MAEGRGPDQEDHLPPLIDYLEDCMKFGESWCLDAAVLKIKLVIKKPNRSKVKNLAAIWLRQLLERTPVGEKADAAKRILREMKAEGEGKDYDKHGGKYNKGAQVVVSRTNLANSIAFLGPVTTANPHLQTLVQHTSRHAPAEGKGPHPSTWGRAASRSCKSPSFESKTPSGPSLHSWVAGSFGQNRQSAESKRSSPTNSSSAEARDKCRYKLLKGMFQHTRRGHDRTWMQMWSPDAQLADKIHHVQGLRTSRSQVHCPTHRPWPGLQIRAARQAERRALAEQKSNLSSADQNPHLRTDVPFHTKKQPLSQKQEGDLAHTLQTLSLGAGPGVSATSAKKAFISGLNGYGTKPFEAPVPANAQEQAERSVSQSSSSPTQARQASRASYTSSSRQKSPPSISCRQGKRKSRDNILRMLQRNNVNFECIDGVITLEDSDKSVQMLRDAEVSYLSRRGRLVLQDDSDSEGSSPARVNKTTKRRRHDGNTSSDRAIHSKSQVKSSPSKKDSQPLQTAWPPNEKTLESKGTTALLVSSQPHKNLPEKTDQELLTDKLFTAESTSSSDQGGELRGPLKQRSFLTEDEQVLLAKLQSKLESQASKADWEGDQSEQEDETAQLKPIQEGAFALMERGWSVAKLEDDGTGQPAAQGAGLDWTVGSGLAFDMKKGEANRLAASQEPEFSWHPSIPRVQHFLQDLEKSDAASLHIHDSYRDPPTVRVPERSGVENAAGAQKRLGLARETVCMETGEVIERLMELSGGVLKDQATLLDTLETAQSGGSLEVDGGSDLKRVVAAYKERTGNPAGKALYKSILAWEMAKEEVLDAEFALLTTADQAEAETGEGLRDGEGDQEEEPQNREGGRDRGGKGQGKTGRGKDQDGEAYTARQINVGDNQEFEQGGEAQNGKGGKNGVKFEQEKPGISGPANQKEHSGGTDGQGVRQAMELKDEGFEKLGSAMEATFENGTFEKRGGENDQDWGRNVPKEIEEEGVWLGREEGSESYAEKMVTKVGGLNVASCGAGGTVGGRRASDPLLDSKGGSRIPTAPHLRAKPAFDVSGGGHDIRSKDLIFQESSTSRNVLSGQFGVGSGSGVPAGPLQQSLTRSRSISLGKPPRSGERRGGQLANISIETTSGPPAPERPLPPATPKVAKVRTGREHESERAPAFISRRNTWQGEMEGLRFLVSKPGSCSFEISSAPLAGQGSHELTASSQDVLNSKIKERPSPEKQQRLPSGEMSLIANGADDVGDKQADDKSSSAPEGLPQVTRSDTYLDALMEGGGSAEDWLVKPKAVGNQEPATAVINQEINGVADRWLKNTLD